MPLTKLVVKKAAPPSRPGRWSTRLFGCCEDPLLACNMCVCPCSATGQVYERATQSRGSCLWVSGLLWVLFFITQSLQSTGNAFSEAYMEESIQDAAPMTILSAVAGTFALFSTVASTYFLCVSRRLVREADGIPEGGCGPCDDCCVSYWCGCCSLTQMFRQYGVTGEKYRACTASGEQSV